MAALVGLLPDLARGLEIVTQPVGVVRTYTVILLLTFSFEVGFFEVAMGYPRCFYSQVNEQTNRAETEDQV